MLLGLMRTLLMELFPICTVLNLKECWVNSNDWYRNNELHSLPLLSIKVSEILFEHLQFVYFFTCEILLCCNHRNISIEFRKSVDAAKPSCTKILLTVIPCIYFFQRLPIRDIPVDFLQVIQWMYLIRKFFSFEYTKINIHPILMPLTSLLKDCMLKVLPYLLSLMMHQGLKPVEVTNILSQGDVVMF